MHRLARGIAAMSGLALVGSLAVASPARADTCYDWDDDTAPVVKSITVTPSSVTLKPGLSSLVTVSIAVTDPVGPADCDSDGVYSDSYSSGVWTVDTGIDLMTSQSGGYQTSDAEDAALTSGTIYDGVWEAKYYLTDSHSFGSWSVDVAVYDNGINKVERPDSGTFTATAPSTARTTTHLSVNATPEPAERGTTLKAIAKLRTANGPLAARTVKYYFRPMGATGWTYRSKATTNSRGVAVRKFTARKSGEWQARFSGSASLRSDIATDSVKVVA